MPGLLAPVNAVSVTRGSTRSLDFVLRDDRGNILNLSSAGVRILFSVKRYLEDPVPLIQKSKDVSGQISVISAVEGKIRVNILPSDTKTLEIGDFLFDVWVVYPAVYAGSPPVLTVPERRYAGVPTSQFVVENAVTIIP